MCNSPEQQTGSHTAWFSAQGPKTDSTHWHYRHSSLGQPRTHCHHTPYATIRACDKWTGTVCVVHLLYSSGNLHKTLLFTCTHSTHMDGYTQTDTLLQFHKGTTLCTANIFITAPFRYTSMNHNTILNYTLLWQPSTLRAQGSSCICLITHKNTITITYCTYVRTYVHIAIGTVHVQYTMYVAM